MRTTCKPCALLIFAVFGFPLNTPLPTRYAHSPFATAQGAAVKKRGHLTAALSSRAGSAVPRDIFCSAPPLGCGSVHVLDGSFARFCVSENVRVPLRYSGQPLHRKIIASRSPNTPWFCLSNRFFASFNQAINSKSIYADIRQPENNASNQSARVCLQTVRVFHTRYFRFSQGYSPSHAAFSVPRPKGSAELKWSIPSAVLSLGQDDISAQKISLIHQA